MVKNLLAMFEAWVCFLAWEDALEKGMSTHFTILPWRTLWIEEPGWLYSPWGHKESDTTEQLILSFLPIFNAGMSSFIG